ncbi:hypothetical protein AAHE18_15G246400 [Arachis hypogaea]
MAQHRSGDRMVMENGLDSLDHYEHDHDHADDGTIEHESRQNGTIELREEEVSVEKVFQYKLVPSWRNQLTLRAFTVSLALSILFTFIVMKLNLTVGIIPSLNVSAGLLGFFFVKTWTKFLEGSGMLKQPFTRQENTVIQTCVVASSGIAFSGGFGSYLFGMSKRVADQTSDSSDFKDLKLGWMIAFLFVVSFLGLFSVVPLRKIMVVDFKLTYPSGIATAHLINSFHTPQGAKLAKKQVKTLGKFFSSSFLWGFFQWFYTATDQCGFQAFPSLGLKAYQNSGFAPNSNSILWSTFLLSGSCFDNSGGITSLFSSRTSLISGGTSSFSDVDSSYSRGKYIIFPFLKPFLNCMVESIGIPPTCEIIGTMHGDPLSMTHTMLYYGIGIIFAFLCKSSQMTTILKLSMGATKKFTRPFQDPRVISNLFSTLLRGSPLVFMGLNQPFFSVIFIPSLFASSGVMKLCVAPISIIAMTGFSLIKALTYIKPFFSVVLVSLSFTAFMSWISNTLIYLSLGLSFLGERYQNFKTGYLSLASPCSMFMSQVIGIVMECVVSPCVFWIFYKAFPDLGTPNSEYPAPNAMVFMNMAILCVEGFKSLPKHCLLLCYILFGSAIVINMIKDFQGKRGRYIPLPMAMAIPFYLGSYFDIDMCVGSLILFVWEKLNKAKANAFGPAVASGLICGDGIWTLPSSILALAGVKPPIFMKFLSRATNARVGTFLGNWGSMDLNSISVLGKS